MTVVHVLYGNKVICKRRSVKCKNILSQKGLKSSMTKTALSVKCALGIALRVQFTLGQELL